MYYSQLVKTACSILFHAHRDDLDKGGYPYVFHPFYLATQMDDASLFYEDASGRTAITASVLLAVAQAIRALPVSRSNQLLVAFFQGESWGRGGSRQWVGDITSFTCEQEVARADSPFNDRICTSPLRV